MAALFAVDPIVEVLEEYFPKTEVAPPIQSGHSDYPLIISVVH